MSATYTEVVYGKTLVRQSPDARHEQICDRLHAIVGRAVAQLPSTHLLPPRTEVQINAQSRTRPDLALIATATGKVWLVVEIVNTPDHRLDTVAKKTLYEETNLPRLWMVDPRYDNIEVYHGGQYGLTLQQILAGAEVLSEKLLPDLQLIVRDLFENPNHPA